MLYEEVIFLDFNSVITILTCIIVLFIFGKIFLWPLKSTLKLIFNSVLGGVCIYIINSIGANFRFHIGLNILTSVLVGLLGLPGALLLIILKIILRVNFLTQKEADFKHSLINLFKNYIEISVITSQQFTLL